jgi:hypothetical protein
MQGCLVRHPKSFLHVDMKMKINGTTPHEIWCLRFRPPHPRMAELIQINYVLHEAYVFKLRSKVPELCVKRGAVVAIVALECTQSLDTCSSGFSSDLDLMWRS